VQVELVDPPAGAQPGERVFVDGFDGAPDAVLNPRHKVGSRRRRM
jgi:aminoacyl tRNA synthase complex-interacting multifunctional protein 1